MIADTQAVEFDIDVFQQWLLDHYPQVVHYIFELEEKGIDPDYSRIAMVLGYIVREGRF